MSAQDINDLPIPYQRYLLSINDLSQGYLILLSEPAQKRATAIESSCQNSAQRSRRFIKHNPLCYFFFLPLGPAPAPAPGCEGAASPADTGGSWRGESTGAGASSETLGAGGSRLRRGNRSCLSFSWPLAPLTFLMSSK